MIVYRSHMGPMPSALDGHRLARPGDLEEGSHALILHSMLDHHGGHMWQTWHAVVVESDWHDGPFCRRTPRLLPPYQELKVVRPGSAEVYSCTLTWSDVEQGVIRRISLWVLDDAVG
jgi:hypothetical protein